MAWNGPTTKGDWLLGACLFVVLFTLIVLLIPLI
jgi:hypothetical protein